MSERRSCRWVPSPQSTSSRSPPRRTSVAEVPRAAVGAEAAVPRKTRSRSTGADRSPARAKPSRRACWAVVTISAQSVATPIRHGSGGSVKSGHRGCPWRWLFSVAASRPAIGAVRARPTGAAGDGVGPGRPGDADLLPLNLRATDPGEEDRVPPREAAGLVVEPHPRHPPKALRRGAPRSPRGAHAGSVSTWPGRSSSTRGGSAHAAPTRPHAGRPEKSARRSTRACRPASPGSSARDRRRRTRRRTAPTARALRARRGACDRGVMERTSVRMVTERVFGVKRRLRRTRQSQNEPGGRSVSERGGRSWCYGTGSSRP